MVAALSAQFPKQQEIAASAEMPVPAEIRRAMGLPDGPILGGFRCESEDGQRVVQLRRDAFVFSFAGRPERRYEGWESFCTEARVLWEEYEAAWKPQAIVRVALRYVNQFVVEQGSLLAEEFITQVQPNRPEFVTPDAGVLDFAVQVSLLHGDINAVSVVNQALLPSADETSSAIFVLDIDTFQGGLKLASQDSSLWEHLEALREKKNQIFQATITDNIEQTLEPMP